MGLLLGFSKAVDGVNGIIGRWVPWLIFVSVAVSSGNALVRYSFNTSSNAWLEGQWYLFSATWLLCAGYTLLRNEHIRIDIVLGRYSKRTQAWVDLLGLILFMLPMTLTIMALGWPMFMKSYLLNERSGDAGGLLRWPIIFFIPLGFLLLSLQGVSEIIKRAAYLLGVTAEPGGGVAGHHGPQEEGV